MRTLDKMPPARKVARWTGCHPAGRWSTRTMGRHPPVNRGSTENSRDHAVRSQHSRSLCVEGRDGFRREQVEDVRGDHTITAVVLDRPCGAAIDTDDAGTVPPRPYPVASKGHHV